MPCVLNLPPEIAVDRLNSCVIVRLSQEGKETSRNNARIGTGNHPLGESEMARISRMCEIETRCSMHNNVESINRQVQASD